MIDDLSKLQRRNRDTPMGKPMLSIVSFSVFAGTSTWTLSRITGSRKNGLHRTRDEDRGDRRDATLEVNRTELQDQEKSEPRDCGPDRHETTKRDSQVLQRVREKR